MLIDPFTLIAQLVNFAILLVALKFLLFDRVVRHMDERQARLRERREEAEELLARANAKGQELDRRLAELDREREEVLARARQEARAERQRLIEEARREAEALRDRWRRSMEDEQERILERIRARVVEEAIGLAERVLRDLTDADLHERFLAAFERRLAGLDEDERAALRRWIAAGEHPVVVSTAELDDEQRERIAALLRDIAGRDVEVGFERDGELTAGLEIQVGGHAYGWTVEGYLERIGEGLLETPGPAADRSERGGVHEVAHRAAEPERRQDEDAQSRAASR